MEPPAHPSGSRLSGTGGRVLVALLVALAAGALTSWGQTVLPAPVSSLANSGTPWCAVAFALAHLQRALLPAVVVGVLALVCLVTGYYAASAARGYPVATGSVLFWGAAAAAVGPWLGAGAHGLATRRPVLSALGVALCAGIPVGEGAFGLLYVRATTSTGYWVASVVVRLLLLVVMLGRGVVRGPRHVALAVSGACVVAALIVVPVPLLDAALS